MLPDVGGMPEISRFFGIVIRMYFDDHDPPHFHVAAAGRTARVSIFPVGLLNGDLPPRTLALVVEWASLHQAALLRNWELLRLDQSPERVAPLE